MGSLYVIDYDEALSSVYAHLMSYVESTMENLFNSDHTQIYQITLIYCSVSHLWDIATKHFHNNGPCVYMKTQGSVVML